jgi:hypothetical protein
MISRILVSAFAAAFLSTATMTPTVVLAAAAKKEETKKDETKAETKKALSPQQQKMKDCGAEWQAMKKDGRAKGTSWNAFRKECLSKKA